MAELEDDIARVAKLRGLSRTQIAATIERAEAGIETSRANAQRYWQLETDAAIANLWTPMDGTKVDQMRVFDVLPAKSRAFLASIERDISARRYMIALELYAFDEERLIETIKERLAQKLAAW